MRGLQKSLLTIAFLLILSLLVEVKPIAAQAGTPSELIATVNALRQSQGLTPYTVDSFLMSFAQSHSDYMASIGTWTHLRADGSTAFDHGIKENVAMGMDMSVSYCVYTVWSDWTHWETMVGYTSGKVGAGVTVSGSTVYYTLNVLPAGTSYNDNSESSESNTVSYQQQVTQEIILPVTTSTPDQEGIIYHIVQYGETLWNIAIAYDVTIDEILKNSSLPLGTTEVFEGQRLVIQPATEPTSTPIPTPTPVPPTPTPTQPRPTMTPFPTRTPFPTSTPTQPPSLITRALGETKYVGIGLILASGLGLILVTYFGFLKKS
jgi:uncharacterized protein YkwD